MSSQPDADGPADPTWLPSPESLFPKARSGSIVLFWVRYWLWFFIFLPWILLRQVIVSIGHALTALLTWNRVVSLHGGKLRLVYINTWRSFLLTTLFGERFCAIHFEDVLIDPGPTHGRARVGKYLRSHASDVSAVVVTHAHEEHTGNAPFAASQTGAPVYASAISLREMAAPAQLSIARRTFMGQPERADGPGMRTLEDELRTPRATLEVIQSPGHCPGHISLFDRERGVLFAGDSFLHAIFTAPNNDVSTEDWILTLERYLELGVRTMVGTHGPIFSDDDALERRWFVVKRVSPHALIQKKLEFLRWAQRVVSEGEARGLPYGVIEACLFPWRKSWSWSNWFFDETGRLFSAGEFSRTRFVRSLSATPDAVPPRFTVRSWLRTR